MKKTGLFITIFLFAVLLLSSCASRDYTPEVTSLLEYPFEVNASTDEYKFNMKRESGTTTVTLISPKTLEGLTLEKKNTEIKATYEGLVVPLPVSAASKIFILDNAASHIASAIENGSCLQKADGDSIIFTATEGIYVYSLVYDKNEGVLVSFEINENDEKTIFILE